jgi:hypothetical protein
MNLALLIVLFVVLALVAYNAITFFRAQGTVADRLAAGFKGSMTIFALIWATLVSMLTNGMDVISSITNEPQFSQVGNAVKEAVPPQWGQWIVVATLLLPLIAGVAGRTRTMNAKVN